MKRFLLALAALALAFRAGAFEYKTIDVRRTGNSPVRESFYAGDSIAFGYYLTEDNETYDLTEWDMVTWEIASYTNSAECWMSVTGRIDNAEGGEISVETMLPLSVVPVGQYKGYVKAVKLTAGGDAVASQRTVVEQTVQVRYGNTELSPDAIDNEDLIAQGAFVRQAALDAETLARVQADAVLSNALADAVSEISGDMGDIEERFGDALDELRSAVFDEMQGQLGEVVDELELVKRAIEYGTASEGLTYEERDGELWCTGCEDGNPGTLVIPAFHDGRRVRGIAAGADLTGNADTVVFWGEEIEVEAVDEGGGGLAVRRPAWPDGGPFRLVLPRVRELPAHCFGDHSWGDGWPVAALYAPRLERVGKEAFYGTELERIDLPALKYAGSMAFQRTPAAAVSVPELLEMHADLFGNAVTNLHAPKVQRVRGRSGALGAPSCFENLEIVSLPSCTAIGERAFDDTCATRVLKAPKLERLEKDNWLTHLETIEFPKCRHWGAKVVHGFDRGYDPDGDPETGENHHCSHFSTNTALKRVVLGVEKLPDHAFRNCTQLRVVELPELLQGGRWAFAGCTNLVCADMPKMVKSAWGMFEGCTRLRWCGMPEALDIEGRMFAGCRSIRQVVGRKPIAVYAVDGEGEIDLPPYLVEKMPLCAVWARKAERIGREAFLNVDPEADGENHKDPAGSVYVLDLPLVREVGASAFRNQDRLRSISLPKCEEIGEAAFRRCGSFAARQERYTDEEWVELVPLAADRPNAIHWPELGNVRRIGPMAFAGAGFGNVYWDDLNEWEGGGKWVKTWSGEHLRLPNATEIARNAFFGAWKLLSIDAPNWVMPATMDELRVGNRWSGPAAGAFHGADGRSSLTNIVHAGSAWEDAALGVPENLYGMENNWGGESPDAWWKEMDSGGNPNEPWLGYSRLDSDGELTYGVFGKAAGERMSIAFDFAAHGGVTVSVDAATDDLEWEEAGSWSLDDLPGGVPHLMDDGRSVENPWRCRVYLPDGLEAATDIAWRIRWDDGDCYIRDVEVRRGGAVGELWLDKVRDHIENDTGVPDGVAMEDWVEETHLGELEEDRDTGAPVVYYDKAGRALYVRDLHVERLTDYEGNAVAGGGGGSGGGGNGVLSLNGLAGAVTLAGGENVSLKVSGKRITINAETGGEPSDMAGYATTQRVAAVEAAVAGLEERLWAEAPVHRICPQDEESQDITLSVENGVVQVLESTDYDVQHYVMLPEADSEMYGVLVLLICKNDEPRETYSIGDEHIVNYAGSELDGDQPWIEGGVETGVFVTWKLRFESPPGSSSWWFMGVEELRQ